MDCFVLKPRRAARIVAGANRDTVMRVLPPSCLVTLALLSFSAENRQAPATGAANIPGQRLHNLQTLMRSINAVAAMHDGTVMNLPISIGA